MKFRDAPKGNFGNEIEWSRFAYIQYATDKYYLCNSVLMFEALDRLGSRADRVLLYPAEFLKSESDSSEESVLLRLVRDRYEVKLKPIKMLSKGLPSG